MAKQKKPRKKKYSSSKFSQGGATASQNRQKIAAIEKTHKQNFETDIRPLLSNAGRTGWELDFADAPHNADSALSKQGGTAFMYVDDEWPTCSCCSKSMVLLLQIMPEDQPEPLKGISNNEIFQVFLCRFCEPGATPSEADRMPYLVRYRIADEDVKRAIKSVPGELPGRSLLLNKVESFEDYPGAPERPLLGVDLNEEQSWLMAQAGYPKIGDKLFGWPRWMHNIGWHKCSECDELLTPLLQLQPSACLDLDWGLKSGLFYFSVCANHRYQYQGLWQSLETTLNMMSTSAISQSLQT